MVVLGCNGLTAPATLITPAKAQDYPNRVVSLVVPYPPGGGVDVLARVVAERLSGVIGQQVIVDNRVGGSGLVGTRATIRSAPDGYTLFFGAHRARSRSIRRSTPMRASIRARTSSRSACSPRCRWRCSRIRRSRARPSARWCRSRKKDAGKLNIGTSAVGTGGYLSAELFKSITGVRGDHRALQGHGAADERSARRPGADRVWRAAAGHGQSVGRHAARHRDPRHASASACCPTSRPAHESGLPGFESVLHCGLLAPRRPPRPIVDKLNAAMRQVAVTDEVKKRINNEGGDPMTSTPEEYAADIAAEYEKMGRADRSSI